ncbi:Omp28-related outer membrane protein [uncultured Psychroserpens sp.]|uniref:Omp28-related outer membrane protein n=1 Tax=uncultured Psychroserpens sp. TaxID=255436 RepID=UPI002611B9C9|nr:Omp28-related outer membrane protein [uncultured Psychroserpens sp.]
MKIKSLTKIFLFVAVAALFSCSSSEDGGGGDGGGNNGPTSLTINASSFFVDFGEAVTFDVKTNEGTDVTSEATIRVNGTPISGATYTASETGTYTIDATYENLTSASITLQVLPVIESISVEVNSATVNLGSRIDYTVLARDTQGNDIDVTDASVVYINDSESDTGAKYVPGSVGAYNGYAVYNGFTSETVTVTVEDNATTPAMYNKKALVEDYTGTWCGFCPRVSYGIEQLQDATNDAVIVAVHNGDEMSNSFGGQMESAFQITGFPTAWVNRSETWNFPEPNNLDQVMNFAEGMSSSGISISSAVKGNDLSFMVNVGFGQNASGNRLVVFLLENGLIFDQENYTSYYGGTATINNFVHDHVLRHSFTAVLGDAIPSGEAVANNTYRMKVDYAIPPGSVANTSNLEIVAMIVGSNNQVINVNKVSADSVVAFD